MNDIFESGNEVSSPESELMIFLNVRKYVFVTLGGVLMMGVALTFPESDPIRWIVLYFFGFGVVFFMLMIAFRRKIYLKMKPEGFEVHFPFGTSGIFKWSEISEIEVRSFPFVGQRRYPNFSFLDLLCFYYEKEIINRVDESSTMKAATSRLGALPFAFGENDEKSASILNAWRSKYR